MEKAIRFNPLDKNQTSFDFVETSWKVVDEYYTATNKGPLLTGEVWKDTAENRRIIEQIIALKFEFKKYENDQVSKVYRLLHGKVK